MNKLTKSQRKKLHELLNKFIAGYVETGWRPNGEDIEQFIEELND